MTMFRLGAAALVLFTAFGAVETQANPRVPTVHIELDRQVLAGVKLRVRWSLPRLSDGESDTEIKAHWCSAEDTGVEPTYHRFARGSVEANTLSGEGVCGATPTEFKSYVRNPARNGSFDITSHTFTERTYVFRVVFHSKLQGPFFDVQRTPMIVFEAAKIVCEMKPDPTNPPHGRKRECRVES